MLEGKTSGSAKSFCLSGKHIHIQLLLRLDLVSLSCFIYKADRSRTAQRKREREKIDIDSTSWKRALPMRVFANHCSSSQVVFLHDFHRRQNLIFSVSVTVGPTVFIRARNLDLRFPLILSSSLPDSEEPASSVDRNRRRSTESIRPDMSVNVRCPHVDRERKNKHMMCRRAD